MTPVCLDKTPAPKTLSSLCESLDWDSNLFGIRIGKVIGNRLAPESAAGVLRWAREHSADCVYFLADTDGPTMCAAEAYGFRLVDIRTTLDARLMQSCSGRWASDGVRESAAGDIEALRAIAARSYTDSRFYQDGGFVREQCDELYRIWIEKCCRGYADIVLVAEQDELPAGYVTCHLSGDGSGHIGLVGVDGSARGSGLGHKLVRHALCWFVEHEAREVSVVTQGRNVAAQRLYQRSGFLTRNVQLWYHLWPPKLQGAA